MYNILNSNKKNKKNFKKYLHFIKRYIKILIEVERSGKKWFKMLWRWNKVLIGEYEHSLDVKGRLILPAKIREDMGDKFIVTKGLDGCLFGFSQNEWTNFEEKLKTLPLTNKNARDFVRFFLSGATECEIDKQGRFLITSNWREYATLEKDAIIIGVGTRIEIWNREKWKSYNSDENISADEIAENMTMLGI